MNGSLNIAIIMMVYIIILWGLLFFVWHRGYKEWKANRSNRPRTLAAKLLDKRLIKMGDENPPLYYMLFEFENRQREYPVDEETYSSVRVGEEGDLHLKGETFDSFEAKSGDQKADEVLRRMMR